MNVKIFGRVLHTYIKEQGVVTSIDAAKYLVQRGATPAEVIKILSEPQENIKQILYTTRYSPRSCKQRAFYYIGESQI